ncbi:DUF6622 family protein [Variovorax robiniae]|uniref:DUF6622 family protein n=2 Tax=Variovorax robiniae TaxID=1836199 RepID=A0ABU8X9F1_9BURK
MLLQILSHTPRWVFVLFAVLVWFGAKQLLASSVSLARTTVMPIAMTALSMSGVLSAFGDSPMALVGWAVAAIALAALLLQRGAPAGTRYDADARRFHVPGSAVPLVLMMAIFVTKYAVGVVMAMHPELAHNHNLALGIGTLYGAFTGTFAGRAIRLWQLAIRHDRSLAAEQAA